MSLGSQVCHRSRIPVSLNSVVAPRDSLPFLFQRPWRTYRDLSLINSTKPPDGKSHEAKNGDPLTGTPSEDSHSTIDCVPIRRVRSSPEEYLKTLQNNFQCTSNTLLRACEKAEIYQRNKSRRRSMFRSTGNEWSYDWRIPLEILKQAHKVEGHWGSEPSPVVRYDCSEPHKYEYVRADQIPKPSYWTPITFTAFVQDLTQSPMSRLMHRKLYKKDENHYMEVRKILLDIFFQENLRTSLTPTAFHDAFDFFYKHSMVDCVRKLFNLMAELQIPMSLKTFDIMLRATGEASDLEAFTKILNIMVGRNVKPNAKTWVYLIAAVTSDLVKVLIANRMRALGLIDGPEVVQSLVKRLMPIELAAHLQKGQGIHSFIQYLDSTYGHQWMSSSTANSLFYELGIKGRATEAVEVLKIMEARKLTPDRKTLSHFLWYCGLQKSKANAREVLYVFKLAYGIIPRARQFEHLFMLAWRTQSINCCRAIWRTACLEGYATNKMHERILESLLSKHPEVPQSRIQRFLKNAGKVIVGIRTYDVNDILDGNQNGDSVKSWPEKARALVASDIDAFVHYGPDQDFAQLFDAALERDQDWWTTRAEHGDSIRWQFENAVVVKIRPKHTRASPDYVDS